MLNDTSFAIHPQNSEKIGNTSYQDIGELLEFKKTERGYRFQCTGGYVYILFYRPDIVRIVMNPNQIPELDDSRAVVGKQQLTEVSEVRENDLTLNSEKLQLRISRKPFRIQILDQQGTPLLMETSRGMGFKKTGEVIGYKVMHEDDHYYGFGEKTGFLDKRGEKYEMWNTDVYAPHNPETDPLYQSIPYFMTLRNGRAHGLFFDNTYKTVFDLKSEPDYFSFMAEGGQLDYYMFAGPSPKDVVEQYTYLTGRMPVPPKWALGYHQSRYSYETEQEVREVAGAFLEKKIPLDVIYFDIHYMNGYRVFTFDHERFPDPERLIADLKKAGIRVVPIVDPGVKKDPEYPIYQEGIQGDHFCKYLEGNLYTGDVWPGESAFPDFTDEKVRKWWGEKHAFYRELGVEGIWNDMNEPAVFNETKTMDTSVMHRNDGKPATHRALHNIYGFMMGKATYEGMKEGLQGKRPFLLTRAGFAGIQRYAAVWTGDNRSFWEHLQMSLPMVMNLGLSGVAFAGTDVGGFAHDSNGELLTRWMQAGAFTPYFRNHSAIGTRRQEPWAFGEEYEAIMKKYIELRYQWLPQLYNLFRQAHQTGVPVMRPLLMEYPDDPKTYRLHDQFMIGDNVIVAPIMSPGVTDRAVYLPEGEWADYFSGDMYEGNKVHLIHAELDQLPVFIKRGTIIAHGSMKQSTMEKDKQMTFHVYAHHQGNYQYTFYDDDGETFDYEKGKFLEIHVSMNCTKEKVELELKTVQNEYHPLYKTIQVVIHHLDEGQKIEVNGKSIARQQNQAVISVPVERS
ncbi:alpha-glucosidase [Melghiribacillus thermohalophilus]|uniref:Alpha-glucosidase n=1 Tax=Melghiribacillus thermohalophilus TaxID=1324956 RepID=A0A4R3N2F0_9BACI|nr:glycoside hydrolase family 31 protein [Melghiribacillus thermohalophilus]TCT22447.1 alpha-glucosidase [Melghiribacillus thermohalophilus]